MAKASKPGTAHHVKVPVDKGKKKLCKSPPVALSSISQKGEEKNYEKDKDSIHSGRDEEENKAMHQIL